MRGVPWNGELFDWTPERIKRMRQLFQDGEPASAIARMIGAPSRSSVMGKLHRLGIFREHVRVSAPDVAKARARSRVNPSTIVRKHGNKVYEQSRPNQGPIIQQRLPAPNSKPIRLIDADPNVCRWIAGETDGPNTMLCGALALDGSSYCAHHDQRARA